MFNILLGSKKRIGEDMADLGDLRNYWKSEDFLPGDKVKFHDSGMIGDIDFSKERDGSKTKKAFKIMIAYNKKIRELVLNKASIDSLSAAWGKDTEQWINREATVTFETQLAYGKKVKVLVLVPAEGSDIV